MKLRSVRLGPGSELRTSLFESDPTQSRPAYDIEVREGLLLITPKDGESSETVITSATNIAWGSVLPEASEAITPLPIAAAPSTVRRAVPGRKPER